MSDMHNIVDHLKHHAAKRHKNSNLADFALAPGCFALGAFGACKFLEKDTEWIGAQGDADWARYELTQAVRGKYATSWYEADIARHEMRANDAALSSVGWGVATVLAAAVSVHSIFRVVKGLWHEYQVNKDLRHIGRLAQRTGHDSNTVLRSLCAEHEIPIDQVADYNLNALRHSANEDL